MNPRPLPLWRQLAPVTVAVLAVHALLLQQHTQAVVVPAAEAARSFVTRTIAAAPPAVAAAPAATPAPAAPAAKRLAAKEPPARKMAVPEVALIAAQRAPEAAPLQVSAPVPAAPVAAEDTPAPTPDAGPVAAPAPALAEGAGGTMLAIPAPARLHYDLLANVRGITIHGNAELAWRHDGAAYEATLSLHGMLLPRREQRSSGRITAEGLAPTVFYDRSRSEQAAHFDHDAGQVTFSNNRPDAALATGMQDRLSVVLQLGALIGGAPERYVVGTQIAIPTASTREAETWFFDVVAEDELALPGGAVRALKLQRQPRKEFDQRIELWLAPRMDYAPVRLRLTNPNGDTVDQRWASTDRG